MNFANTAPAEPPLALWLMLIVLALAASITVWAIRQLFSNRRRSELLKTQTEFQLKLLDKISSSQELRGFLESESVRSLFDSQGARTEAQDRILGCLVPGCILTPAGALLVVIGQGAVRFVGSLAVAIGLGFLVAGFVAYRLVRSWGS